MNAVWKKIFIRDALYIYARDSLIFFMNLYIWTQNKDLQEVALFNLYYLAFHTLAFPVFLPLLKKGNAQKIMRIGISGVAIILIIVALLQDRSSDYVNIIGIFIGVFNGMYWLVNHMFNFDQSNNENRASFFSYKAATKRIGKLSVPFVGWLMFVLFGDTQAGYNAIFSVSALAAAIAVAMVEIPQPKESRHKMLKSFRHILETPRMKLKFFTSFYWGLALRSALASVLLPFLIFQIVESESNLSFIQTLIEVAVVGAAYAYGRYKHNIKHLGKLFLISLATLLIGLSALLVELSATTYAIFIVANIIAHLTGNTASGTFSNNFATLIKKNKEHRAEYIVLRELFTIPGFMAGYVFVYFFAEDLTPASLRPLIIAMMVSAIIALSIQYKLWNYTKRSTSNHEKSS